MLPPHMLATNPFEVGSKEHQWFSDTYDQKGRANWSKYATELYCRLRDKARAEGWLNKLRYLLYEGDVNAHDAKEFAGLEGVLLQAKPDEKGLSRNPGFVPLQMGNRVIAM